MGVVLGPINTQSLRGLGEGKYPGLWRSTWPAGTALRQKSWVGRFGAYIGSARETCCGRGRGVVPWQQKQQAYVSSEAVTAESGPQQGGLSFSCAVL